MISKDGLFKMVNVTHEEPSEFAGKIVEVVDTFDHRQYPGLREVVIEDWWDRLSDKNVFENMGNPACLIYQLRITTCPHEVPMNHEILYGKYQGLGVLLHRSEIKGKTN